MTGAAGLIWAIIVLLAALWFLGFAANVGWWIHVVLVIAILGLLFNLFVTPLLTTQRSRTVVHERDVHHHDDDDHLVD